MTIEDVKQFVILSKSLAEDKNLDDKVVHDIVEQALALAWRRDYGHKDQNVRSVINTHKGTIDVYVMYEVVDEVENSYSQLTLKEAQKMQPNAKLGETIEEYHKVQSLSRVAAQTAKQIILQKLREAERDIVLTEAAKKVGNIVNANVVRVDSRMIYLEVNRAQGIMPLSEQIQDEKYYIGQRLKVLLKKIDREGRHPQLILSRGSSKFLELLFRAEVPEMESGAVEIKNIIREAGVRSKVAVTSKIANVDPVGTLVGGHGARVQSVNVEIGDQEKIDIVVYSDEPKEYIVNALSSTEVANIEILAEPTDDKPGQARVVVSKDQLSVAIGRLGQNVRLAGKLTGYEIDIVDQSEVKQAAKPKPAKEASPAATFQPKEKLEENLIKAIEETSQETDEGEGQAEKDGQPDKNSV